MPGAASSLVAALASANVSNSALQPRKVRAELEKTLCAG
jgi:hypothetical protein